MSPARRKQLLRRRLGAVAGNQALADSRRPPVEPGLVIGRPDSKRWEWFYDRLTGRWRFGYRYRSRPVPEIRS